jgi:hypothetical protein
MFQSDVSGGALVHPAFQQIRQKQVRKHISHAPYLRGRGEGYGGGGRGEAVAARAYTRGTPMASLISSSVVYMLSARLTAIPTFW